MPFDPNSAQPFDPSSAQPVNDNKTFDASSAQAFDPQSAQEVQTRPPLAPNPPPPDFFDDMKDRFLGELKDYTGQIKKTKRVEGQYVPINNPEIGSLGLSAIDMPVGFAGQLVGNAMYGKMLEMGYPEEQAAAARDSVQQNSSVRELIRTWGQKMGLNLKSVDKALDSPDFLQTVSKKIDQVNKAGLSVAGLDQSENANQVLQLIEAGLLTHLTMGRGGKVPSKNTNIPKVAENLIEKERAKDFDANAVNTFEGEGGAQPQFDAASAQEIANQLPEISPEFKVPPPIEESQTASATEAGQQEPLNQYVYDLNQQYPSIEGQGPDVDTSNIQSPYMSAKDTEIANTEGTAGPNQMELTPNILKAEIENKVVPNQEGNIQYLRTFGGLTEEEKAKLGVQFNLLSNFLGQHGDILTFTGYNNKDVPFKVERVRNYTAKDGNVYLKIEGSVFDDGRWQRIPSGWQLHPEEFKELAPLWKHFQGFDSPNLSVKQLLNKTGYGPAEIDTPKQELFAEKYTKKYLNEAKRKAFDDYGNNDSGLTYLRTFGGTTKEERQLFSKVPRILSSTPDAVQRKINQLVSPYQPDELSKLHTDMRTSGQEDNIGSINNININTVTKNVAKNIANSPSLTWLVTSIRKATGLVAEYANDLGKIHNPIMDTPKDVLSRVLSTATELQRQHWQDYGKSSGIREFSDDDFIKAGGRQEDLPLYRQIRQVNELALQILMEARKDLTGEDVQTPVVGYHPRSYGIGPHALMVFDRSTQTPAFVHRYKSYEQMASDYREMKAALEAADTDHRFDIDYRADAGDWENPFTHLSAVNIPDSIQKILNSIEEKIETRKRTFEMKRATGDIQGMIQFLRDGTTPDPELINVWNGYLKNVIKFKKNVELFKLQRQIMENASYYDNKPHLYDFMIHTLQDELGQNVANKAAVALERGTLDTINELAKAKMKAQGTKLLSPDDFVLSSDSARYYTKLASSGASSAALLFNVANALTNAIQMPLTGIVGLPLDSLGRLRASPAQALWWTVRANAEFMKALGELVYTKTTGTATRASQVLDHYNRQGFVQAHMFDEIADVASARPGNLIAKALDTGKKWTNDFFIETPTNATALLYYHILVHDIASDHLTKAGILEHQREPLTIDLAKSWTGDYSSWAKPAYLRKAGIAGDTVSNFANWNMNQWGRMIEAIREIKPEDGKGLAQGVGFMIATWYLYAQLAGGKNSPIFASVDTVRRWLNSGKDKEEDLIPDMNYYAKELGIPNWMFPQKTMLDKAQELLGIQHPIDMSTSQKYTDMIAVNTVQAQILTAVVKTLGLAVKDLFKNSKWNQDQMNPDPIGKRSKDYLDAMGGLPSLVRAEIQKKYGTTIRPDGTVAVDNKFGSLNYTEKDATERIINQLGLRTSRQRDEQQDIQNNRVFAQNLAKQPERLKSYIKDQAIRWAQNPEQDYNTYSDILTNMNKLKMVDPDGYNKLAEEIGNLAKGTPSGSIESEYEKRIATPKERLMLDASKGNLNASKLLMLKKRIDFMNR